MGLPITPPWQSQEMVEPPTPAASLDESAAVLIDNRTDDNSTYAAYKRARDASLQGTAGGVRIRRSTSDEDGGGELMSFDELVARAVTGTKDSGQATGSPYRPPAVPVTSGAAPIVAPTRLIGPVRFDMGDRGEMSAWYAGVSIQNQLLVLKIDQVSLTPAFVPPVHQSATLMIEVPNMPTELKVMSIGIEHVDGNNRYVLLPIVGSVAGQQPSTDPFLATG